MNIFSPLTTEPEPTLQQIEVATFFQLPSFHLIGLPGPEVSEAKERVRSAIDASGFEFPKRRVVINLSPASIRKRGVGVDLSIALAVLNGSEVRRKRIAAWGELGLDGRVKASGQLTRSLYAAWMGQMASFYLAEEEYEAGVCALKNIQNAMPFELRGIPIPELIPIHDLKQAWSVFTDQIQPLKLAFPKKNPCTKNNSPEVHASLLPLNPAVERMVCAAVAGSHHLLLLGPKGVGKSHALEWAQTLQPPMSAEDRLFHALIAELGDSSPERFQEKAGTQEWRSVRRVGSQTRPAALTGGVTQSFIFPGEFSLAHGGVLLADELPEWSRDSREVLREPLERGKVTVNRTKGSFEFPARFQMIANGNLCPCGGWPIALPIPDEFLEKKGQVRNTLRCRCRPSIRDAYLARLSGPILDRMDMVTVLTQTRPQVQSAHPETGSSLHQKLYPKILRVRETLCKTWETLPGWMEGHEVERLLNANPRWKEDLGSLSLGSLRSRHKTVRLALTLAAWDEEEKPHLAHFLEAASYRAEKVISLFN